MCTFARGRFLPQVECRFGNCVVRGCAEGRFRGTEALLIGEHGELGSKLGPTAGIVAAKPPVALACGGAQAGGNKRSGSSA